MRTRALFTAGALLLALAPLCARADDRPISQLHWRSLGPALTEGRASVVVGSDKNALLYYAGTAGGGAWKSVDGGTSWENITDTIGVASVGAIAVTPGADDDVWLGAGETNPRNDVIPEAGLYHSINGGRSWQKAGFADAPDISRIILDPKDPKHIVVGVLGNPFAPSPQRGVFVSFDGGATFTKSLYLSDQSGVSDIAVDPVNPAVLYAGMWHVLRRPWALSSGGSDDGLFKSIDGGKTWKPLTGNGFPSAPIGRIGIAVAPTNPSRVYALVESSKGVVWRSDDAGATWKMTSDDTVADQRPFYFSHVRVSPTNADTVYAVSMFVTASFDAGESFNLTGFGMHPDLHDMWISADGERMAVANDGGVAISVNGGTTWSSSRNLPVAQVYRVAASTTIPYYVCGGLQDNNAYCGPAFNGNMDGITNRDWFKPVEGDGEWAVPDPLDPNLVWADSENGEVQVYDRLSHDAPNVRPYRATTGEDFVLARSKYRFNWESPIAFAAYDPRIAFIGANVLFETTDRGEHWRVISPDLTRDDKSKQQVSKDSVVKDESSAENYGTLLDIETSPLHNGEIWTGSDDGLVHVSLDGGKHWKNVTPASLPADSAVETIAPSTLHDGIAYLSADRHAMGDTAAYIYRTADFGAHWQRVTAGIPAGEYVRAVRPDIHNPRMVYAGTNRGIYVSCDDGAQWQSFQNNLPPVEVRDIRFQSQFDDLLIATHGRAIWVMDDMRVAQSAGCGRPNSPIVMGPRPTIALNAYRDDEGNYQDFVAQQPGSALFGSGPAAVLYWWMPQEPKTRPSIDIYDARGRRVRHIAGKHQIFLGQGDEGAPSYWISKTDGKNTFSYDYSIDGPAQYESAPFFFKGPDEGPTLPPGRYTMAFHLDGRTYRFPLQLRADPLTRTTQAQFEAAFMQQRREYDLLDRVDRMLNELHRVRTALVDANAKAPKVQAAIDGIDAMVATLTSSPKNFEDFVQRPGQLREDVLTVMQAEPAAQATRELYARLEREYTAKAVAYNAWVKSIPTLNATLAAAGVKPVAAPSLAPPGPRQLASISSR
jgi:photosystem II stability/assembly factor-like uncharacterized protein